jgi:hypothetical protein
VHNTEHGCGSVDWVQPDPNGGPDIAMVKNDKGGEYRTTVDQLFLGHEDPGFQLNGLAIRQRISHAERGDGRVDELFDDGYANVRWDSDHRHWPVDTAEIGGTNMCSLETPCVGKLDQLFDPLKDVLNGRGVTDSSRKPELPVLAKNVRSTLPSGSSEAW